MFHATIDGESSYLKCACVCVCVCERERERERGMSERDDVNCQKCASNDKVHNKMDSCVLLLDAK